MVFIFILSLYLLSCGLEDSPYLVSIPDSYMIDNTFARILLPPSYPGYFIRFEIYYRIYISGHPESGLINTSALRSQINSSLNSDFQGLYPLTDKTNSSVTPSNLDIIFSNRRYFKLTLAGVNIDDILSSFSLGGILDIKFPGNAIPELSLNGVPFILQRAVSGPSLIFSPRPNRYFLNHPDLYDTANVTNEINADVVSPNPNTPPDQRYTYVSMYIFAIGRDYLSTFYSQPTHIGIFRLPEAN